MLRFPTSIPLRTAEFNEFKESILSAQKNSQAAQAPTQSSATQQSSGDQAFERERKELRERAQKSKAERIGLPRAYHTPSLNDQLTESLDFLEATPILERKENGNSAGRLLLVWWLEPSVTL
ncbi:hypothetical protein MJO29_002444 [Puccinia striiformis f. sp. tritici]|nr:hypothetical protein Pst134EA_002435 [Puccinia striiformis f. sp. tritici]KAH9463999.1 hypothetical protein Pst134EB_003539 [Puccinia striiformis f. sp. tritici]KAH9471796.1 hypothetical protein Pst134EA_002435 [Puccinia striiformis f. sp. tritici]KAI7966696.1 hypothetical protein MJO29_002444 [Puccinia striiformis f. sp. tritici]KAI9609858.1 hypothetical protein H4Q26_006847 [Puccinia striiformis f. sp. tritici PST-130]